MNPCNGCSVCAACNARRMVETATHLVEHVFPKRLLYFLRWDAGCLNWVAGIAMRGVQCATARTGGVLFVHCFGTALNAHVHFTCACLMV